MVRARQRWHIALAMLFAVAAAAPVHADALSLGTPAQIQRRWTVEDGLPSNAVSAVVNDADGFIWVATLAGLARFDGVRFELHDAAAHPELGSDRFTTMKRTPDGALWLSTEQYELFRFQDQQFSRIEGVSVLSATQAANGWLAYGTTRGVLLVTAGGIRETRPDLIDEAVIELDWPEPDTLLALTDTQLLELEHPGADARIRRRLSFPGRNSGALLRRADGRVLIGRDDGLHQIDRDWHQPPEHLWSDAAVIALSSLDREQILLATATGMAELRGDVPAFFAENRDSRGDEPMLLRAGDTSWRVLADRMVGEGAPDMVASGRISDALIDAERSVWIATHAAGLVQYRSADARLLGRPEGLHGDNVYPLLSTRDGALWVSTLDGGLQRWSGGDAGTWVQPALPFEVVWSLHEARDGGLWVVGDGVCLLRDHACSQAGMPEAMQNQPPVRLVFEDPAGRVWVGTQWALWRREGDQWHTLSATEGTQPGRAARAMVAAPNDHLWLATNGDGLFEFVGGRRARQITTAQGLSSNALRALWRDPDNGELWVGTENRGLCRLRADLQPVAVRCVGTAQGLPSNGIHAIAADAFARFWMNSNQGVFHVDRAELQSLLDGHGERMTRIGVFNAANGLRSSEGNGAVFPSVATDVAGRVWFPTQGGIAIFDPAAVRTTHAPAQARIDRVHVGSTVISAPTSIDVPAPIRAITVAFTANSYVDPEHVQFRYRLAGGSAAWTDIGSQRELQLAALPVGEWSLQVQARNAGADWPESFAAVSLRVRPQWFERTDLRAGAAIVLLLLAGGAFSLRSRRALRRQRELEALVDQRTEDLRNAKRDVEQALDTVREQHDELSRLHRSRTEFAANISHELKTPLTLLTAPLADHPGIAGVIGDDLFAAMRDSGQRMQRLLRQLADLHLIDSAALTLERVATPLDAFVARCVLPFSALAEQRGLRLTTDLSGDTRHAIAIDPFQFEKVLGNLLSNAIKFTPINGAIRLRTQGVDAHAEILVEDSGPGVPTEHRRAIFERFFQVDASYRREHEGSGIGLALAREIVGLHGGTLTYVESALGGAGFLIRLPLADAPTAAPTRAEDMTTVAAMTAASERSAPSVVDALPGPDADRSRPRVLIVEDQAPLRTYLRGALCDRYDVFEAEDGEDGLAQARQWLPDVIVSDVMMPRVDGLTMARALRVEATTRCIPILFLSALDSDRDQVAGLLAGADDYLAKPFSAEVVRARIDARVRARRDLLDALSLSAPRDAAATTSVPPAVSAASSLLARAEGAIRARLGDEDFDLDALVRALATSRSQLHRRLQAEAGISPGELITRTRLGVAAELLAAGQGSVTEVCYTVGFLSLSSFSRAFKAQHGCTPGEYAERIAAR